MVDLPADVEQTLRDLPEGEWSTLQARLRAPDTVEQVRTAVAKHVPADQLDTVMGIVDHGKFLDADGHVDEQKVDEHFGAFFGTRRPPAPKQWGQSSGSPPPSRPGDAGRAAAQKRHNVKPDTDTPTPSASTQNPRGAAGRAAAALRHPPKKGANR